MASPFTKARHRHFIGAELYCCDSAVVLDDCSSNYQISRHWFSKIGDERLQSDVKHMIKIIYFATEPDKQLLSFK